MRSDNRSLKLYNYSVIKQLHARIQKILPGGTKLQFPIYSYSYCKVRDFETAL